MTATLAPITDRPCRRLACAVILLALHDVGVARQRHTSRPKPLDRASAEALLRGGPALDLWATVAGMDSERVAVLAERAQERRTP